VQAATISALLKVLPEQVASWAQAIKDLLVPLTPITVRSTPVAPVAEEVMIIISSCYYI
jgi:hypothetical protein